MSAKLEKYSPRLMVAPTLLVLLIISLVPLIYVLATSVTGSTLANPFNEFVGFDQYLRALRDSVFGTSLLNTFVYALSVTTIQTILGFVLAYALWHERRLGALLRTLALLPLFTPPVAIAMIWKLIYDPNSGLLNYYMMQLGLTSAPVAFLGEKYLAFPSIMAADIWQWTPFCFLLCLSTLQALPDEPYEAARVDGASDWYVFKRLTFPMVLPQLIVIFIFRMLIAFKVFDLIYMLTAGGPGNSTQVASFYIYRISFRQFLTGYGAALSMIVLIAISLVVTFLTKGREALLRRIGQ